MTWQLYEMTGSPLQLGLLGLSRATTTIPVLLFGGMLADAVDRRKLMLVTQLGHVALGATLVAMAVTGSLEAWMFYIVAMTSGLFTALENPARQAIVPNMVPRAELTNALALNSTQRSIAQIGGWPLAGVLFSLVGATANYAVSLGSFIVMLFVLISLRSVPQAERSGRRAFSMKSAAEGFSFVWTHPILLMMMILDFSQNFLGAVRGLLPVFAVDVLHVGPEGLGVLSAATAVGTIFGGLLMSSITQIKHAGIGVLIGVSIFAFCTILFAYNTVFWLATLLLAGTGFGDTVSHVFRGTILQLNIPDHLRGRVTSVNQIFTTGGPPLSQFRAGASASLLGPELAVLAGGLGVLTVVAIIGIAAPLVRRYTIDSAIAASEEAASQVT
jgi:MFS family permease